MTYSLELDFIQSKKEEIPDEHAHAHIYIKTYSSDRNRIFITPECTTLPELESEIDRLHKELEHLRKVAKHKFAKK